MPNNLPVDLLPPELRIMFVAIRPESTEPPAVVRDGRVVIPDPARTVARLIRTLALGVPDPNTRRLLNQCAGVLCWKRPSLWSRIRARFSRRAD